MLFLRRKAGEKIVIDNKIVIEIVRITGNRITLGIAAPSDIKILRGELEPIEPVTSTVLTELNKAS